MRKSLALMLVILMSAGCTTTTHARLATAPPAVDSKDARQIHGVVLLDGTQVMFDGPAELRADGSVQGRVLAPGSAATDGAAAYEPASYQAPQISAYVVGVDGKKANTVGTVLLVVGAAAVAAIVIAAATTDSVIGCVLCSPTSPPR